MPKPAVYLVPLYYTVARDQERPYCLNYQNADGELSSTRFTYDRKGLNTRAFYQNITGGRSSRNLHDFDAAGRMVRKIREYNDGETSEERFIYNTKGRLVEETFLSSSGASGSAKYHYGRKGNAIAMDCQAYKGWFSGRIEFTIDRDGKRLEGRILRNAKPAGSIAYKYDSNGNLILEEWTIGKDWSQTLQYVYEPVD